MRKQILSLIVAGGLATAVLSQPAAAGVFLGVNIGVAPPERAVEVVPAARVGYVWAPGYWRWDGHRHVWANGYWVRGRPGYEYRAAYWEHAGPNWRFHDGYWARHR
ncbi:hypothetical protein ELE36_17305 [Pseudolysobacter antarcticus]|uniref:BcpO-related WXXGXW repeat protein n=1 Tax=Pseudolysobacter antarcticus TaxID=2511995 RepID=A0A411HNB8_9GAMM|nr:YXWGXW repeat-containing protein [Pseudolysobacter antarcticus]QBB71979.1 hypothetical protein ELE36_17305 [Pseudolysobacter antarcticus]